MLLFPLHRGKAALGSPVHAVLLGASAEQAQDPPVMIWGRGVVRQADQVVVALLLAALGAVFQGVEASPRPHAGAAACLALPFLHPVGNTAPSSVLCSKLEVIAIHHFGQYKQNLSISKGYTCGLSP